MNKRRFFIVAALLLILMSIVACVASVDSSDQTAPLSDTQTTETSDGDESTDGVTVFIAIVLWIVVTVVLFLIDPTLGYLWLRLSLNVASFGLTKGGSSSSRSGRGGGRSGRGN